MEEEVREGDEEWEISVEEVIILDEGTRGLVEEEIGVEDGGCNVVEGKVVLTVVREVLIEKS